MRPSCEGEGRLGEGVSESALSFVTCAETTWSQRLNVALVNNEVTEVSNKTLLQELQEARDTISRLTAHHARSMGWDARLTAALKERDDMQQERDSESHRARLAESRFAALKDKANKVQNEVRRLQEALEEKRQHRLESSESILSEARSRLQSARNSVSTPVLLSRYVALNSFRWELLLKLSKMDSPASSKHL
jgi:chromosome segregation ATPase